MNALALDSLNELILWQGVSSIWLITFANINGVKGTETQ
jgi:hypothetical protein